MSTSSTFYAINAITKETLEGEFNNTTKDQIDQTVQKAVAAFEVYRKKDKNSVADFLDTIADEILNLGSELIERCHLETALPIARLEGERGRTMGQLKLFAAVVREGSWVDSRIDRADPERKPFPKSDIRHMLIPLGPVAIFGASNFPLAFSVAGGDTASALASGCPVVVKAHEAHPGTSKLVAKAIQNAVKKCNMPDGTFSIIYGNTNSIGENLVKHPGIKAVGFTGSNRGGNALVAYANSRLEPIPVFAEMGSTNPVFILPNALKLRGEQIASSLATSITLGVGQFCTNPGLTFVQKSETIDSFYTNLKSVISETKSATMLTPNMLKAFNAGLKRTCDVGKVEELAIGQSDGSENAATAIVLKTTIENFIKNDLLAEENFGPSSIVVEANTKKEILDAAKNLKGHLTATIHGTDEDFVEFKELFNILELKVGRIVINGYPTGVEVCHAMVHGGPHPSTSAPQSTSVGTNAIKRFVRPICFQDYPNAFLPDALKNENNVNLWRLIDGELSKSNIT